MIPCHSSPISKRSLGLRPLACLAVACLAVMGCGHHEKSEYPIVSKPPTVRIVYPKSRTIVRVVDINDKVKKGDLLTKLFVPELVEDFETKKATVKLDGDLVDDKSAEASLVESKAILAKFEAEVERWDMEVKLLTQEVELEHENQRLGVELGQARDVHE